MLKVKQKREVTLKVTSPFHGNYYAHAASFTQKHTSWGQLSTSAFAVPRHSRASAFEDVGSGSEGLPNVDQACSMMRLD